MIKKQKQFDKALIIVIFILVACTRPRLCSSCAVVWCTWCSEEDGLSGSFLLDVGSEALEEFGIFSLGHGPQDRRRSPAARIHYSNNKQTSSQRSYTHTLFINNRCPISHCILITLMHLHEQKTFRNIDTCYFYILLAFR